MKAKNLTRLICGVLLLLATQVQAHSQHDDYYPFYGGFALGFSGSDEDCDYYGYNCDGDDTSFKFYGGKRFHENLAFEVSFQDLGKLTDDQGLVTTTAESSGLNFSLHGIIPVSELGYFYGKAGFMAWETDYTRVGTSTTRTSDDGTDFTFGAGFAFAFAEKYEFRVEFERLNELDDNFTPGGSYITVISFGGTINFE
jgi:OOP family OmpA-OmpF porin